MSQPLKILFLRSAHSGDDERGGPEPSPDLAKMADMWTLLFDAVLARLPNAKGLIARVGRPYTVQYNDRLTEVRVPDLLALSAWNPNAIIDRGGYKEYLPIHAATPDAFRLYVGCGSRWNPRAVKWLQGVRYDMTLVDSPGQMEAMADEMSGAAGVVVFHKPAAETIFKPVDVPKRYHVVFICHRDGTLNPHCHEEFKGIEWIAERIPDGLRVLRIGPRDEWFTRASKRLDVTVTGLIPRAHVPRWACQAEVGVVCDNGHKDSGPRVLPEFLAMDIPVIVRKTVRTDHWHCVPALAGKSVGEDPAEFVSALAAIQGSLGSFRPRLVYDGRMSIGVAADRLAGLIERSVACR